MENSGKKNQRSARKKDYYPGMHKKNRRTVYEIVEQTYQEWSLTKNSRNDPDNKDFPLICISRKIGVGALEIADILGEIIGYRVIDRLILEHIADRNHLDRKLSAFIDERAPGKIEDIVAMIFGEKAFTQNEYSRLLFRAVFSLSDLGPSIFVGRGVHLILPRDRVFAVRLICNDEFRIKRLAKMLKISEDAASLKLNHFDIEQKNFFKNIYNYKTASPQEFDMVINRDYIQDAHQIAEIMASAFKQKFARTEVTAGL